jgi:putative ABC transport system permease protein
MPSREASPGLSVHWGETVRIALRALEADKLKASLTMLGVVIGSAALVLVVTIGTTGKTYIIAQIEGIGTDISYATLHRTESFSVLDDELTPGDLEAVSQEPGVRAAAGTYDLPIEFHLRGKAVHARLVGVTQDFGKIRNLRITSGRYFDADDFSARFKVCLVTDHLAQNAFGFDSAVGNIIPIDQFRCTVIGTFTEGVPTFGQSEIQDQTVLIPFPLVKEISGDNFFQVIYAQATSSDQVEAVTMRMDHWLRSRHRREARYNVENLSSLLETANKISLALTAVLIAIAVLTLVTAGIGIMNIMLVNVSQRTHEIGLRKALGARPAEIRLQFLLEAFFISFTGAVAGVVVAVAIVWPVAGLVRNFAPLGISWEAVAVALVVSSGVGIVFGYRPARAAADMNPIDALRTE